ncbi:precorrin-6y C5,15-methyltransferase (decarboxylating) subunit CbiE [Neomegalonema perideroedes]|uniref:precorrin-6y C5,15-methyltransferase (decarboxylating) subunit CbiE n=1 Tax=Neomegalonema perideroedes TaxID=217219 RepID=UPI00038034B8|nr:precorrin-6y C5,15-methyltransferase (decarboxylating) subunit CbiE [Neomegalonema perideroedes]
MSKWLSIVGIGEDGPAGLSEASRRALAEAEILFGGARHLALVEHPDKRPWPLPFSAAPLLALRGRRVAALASGDPFWHGVGGALAEALTPGEWRAFPAPSTPALIGARLGWRMEEVPALGLHAAPFARLRPHLAPGGRVVATLRDGAAAEELAAWLTSQGFGETRMILMERLGGPLERVRETRAQDFTFSEAAAPVSAALVFAGEGPTPPLCSGLPDSLFDHDGQITKRPLRALALSALAPRPFERLWDVGTGSGSIAIEWLLAHPTTQAVGIEADPARAARARANAAGFGVERLEIREGRAPEALAGLPAPHAVFVGGGASEELVRALWSLVPQGARIVAHAVTLESEALFTRWRSEVGGSLMRIELAEAAPLGRKSGWKAAYPVVQWSVMK